MWCAVVATATALVTFAAGAGAVRHAAGQSGPYYVAVGASESVGVQPVPADHQVVPTDQGYADDLTTMEQRRWPGLQLADFGCPGITAEGALHGGGPCPYASGSQVGTAVTFVGHHRHEVALVTVDLGFNDLWPCLLNGMVDEACVSGALARVAGALPAVLGALRAAGGPRLLIVGLQHADPYVADARLGQPGFALATVPVFDRLNDLLSSDYGAVGAAVTRVPEPRRGVGGPEAIEVACARTWMCTVDNIHPTPDGYRVIAGEIASAIVRAARRPR